MIEVTRLSEDDWQTLRELRLQALAEAPYAFWATHAEEAAYTETQWRQFLRAAAWYVARRDNRFVGLAAGLLRPEAADEPELISMWVQPNQRGHGTGTLLTQELMAWARGLGATTMILWVTDGNMPARRLYERVGFYRTGEHGAVPHGAASGMERMRTLLA
jgi:GNAT superfamily N-acetyltransferase